MQTKGAFNSCIDWTVYHQCICLACITLQFVKLALFTYELVLRSSRRVWEPLECFSILTSLLTSFRIPCVPCRETAKFFRHWLDFVASYNLSASSLQSSVSARELEQEKEECSYYTGLLLRQEQHVFVVLCDEPACSSYGRLVATFWFYPWLQWPAWRRLEPIPFLRWLSFCGRSLRRLPKEITAFRSL